MPKSTSHLQIIGLDKLLSDFQRVTAALTVPEARQAFLTAARIIRDEARRNAPRGKNSKKWYGRQMYGETPGLLRRSIVSRVGKRNTAAAFTSVEVRRGMVNAPHGHLVEWGTKPRRPRSAKVLGFYGPKSKVGSSGFMFTRRVRAMPANPFFARAVASKSGAALQAATVAAGKIIEKRASK